VPTVDGFFPAIKLEMSRAGFQLAVLGRMLRSCLVGADCRDTEEYHPVEGESVDRKWPALITIKPRRPAMRPMATSAALRNKTGLKCSLPPLASATLLRSCLRGYGADASRRS
jgi:hypothetical protein